MKKIANPYTKFGKDYNCFGCSPWNKSGLKLSFYETNDCLFTEWLPTKDYMGFLGVLHGGIQATLFDEIASWIIAIRLDTSGLTYSISTRYIKPVKLTGDKIKVKAKIKSKDKKYATITAQLFDKEKNICSEGEVIYRIFPKKIAQEKLYFPGKEAFYFQNKS